MATLPILVRFASAGAGPLSSSLGSMITSLSGPQGVAVAAGVAAAAIGNMTRLAAEEEANIAGLSASLAAAGVSYRDNATDIENLINKREELAFADDAQRDSLSRLVQMTGSLAEAQNLQAIAMDLARGKNMDLVAASELIGKVSSGNVGILKRYGIVLKDGTTATEALEAVSARFAGQSEAYSKTAQAGWERFGNELANVQEGIGTALLPALLDASAAATDFLQQIQDDGTLEALGAAINTLGDVIATNVASLRVFADGFQGVADASNTLGQSMYALSQGKFAESNELLAGLAERTQERLARAYEFGEATIERFSDTAATGSDDVAVSVGGLADAADSSFGRVGDAADEMTETVKEDYGALMIYGRQLADSLVINADLVERAAERVVVGLDAEREAVAGLAEDNARLISRANEALEKRAEGFDKLAEMYQDARDAEEEAVKATQKASDEAVAAVEKANNEILAAQEKANNEKLREQERADEKMLREQQKAEDERLAILQKNAENLATVTQQMHADSITQLDDWMKAGTISVEYGAKKMDEALRLIPEAVRGDILVFDDFTLHLDNLSPEWQGALQPFVDMVNSLPEETREALGLDLNEWEFYTEALKQLQGEAATAVEIAQKRIRDALAYKEETNVKLGAPPGGRGIGFAGPRGMPVPSDSPIWNMPSVPFNPIARQTGLGGMTVHGSLNVYARSSVADTLNELAAMRR
jgi:hypothetical protein